MNIEQLKETYKQTALSLVKLFCEKQEFEFNEYCFCGDMFDGLVWVGDMVFNLTDIVFDLENDCKKGFIVEWYDYVFINSEKINYRSYIAKFKR